MAYLNQCIAEGSKKQNINIITLGHYSLALAPLKHLQTQLAIDQYSKQKDKMSLDTELLDEPCNVYSTKKVKDEPEHFFLIIAI